VRAALPLVLLALVVAADAHAADAPPRFLVFDVAASRATHALKVDTVVADDSRQVASRRYRTTLLYRCDGHAWRTAFRTTPTAASITRSWRYPARLAGHRCQLRAIVELGRLRGRSVVLSRLL
jgi:hypothetical protein